MNNLKEIKIKCWKFYYLDYIIKNENFNLDNNVTDKKSYEHLSVYNISYKNLIAAKSFVLDSIK